MPSLNHSDKVLLTVHGIWSDNAGLDNVSKHCVQKLPGLICDSYFYGTMVPIRHLDRTIIGIAFRAIREKIELVYLKYVEGKERRLYVVAHSLGTLGVIKALEANIRVKIEGLVLLGSIVPRDQHWDGHIQNGALSNPPLAVIRPLDRIVRAARQVGGDSSGALGFVRNGVNFPIESYKDGGHSSYDPHDSDDIVQVIANGVSSVPVTDYDSWYAKLSLLRKVRLIW